MRARPVALSNYRHSLARAGRITSSRVATIIDGNYKAWNTLATKMRTAKPAPIGSQRNTGVAPLDWGHRHEDQACDMFWLHHPEYEMYDEHWCYWHDPRAKVLYELCGTSPDRTLYQDMSLVSGVEAKCPYDPQIFRRYWSEARLPPEYRPQVTWHQIVCNSNDWWFVAFDPRAEEEVKYFEVKCERDPAYESMFMEKINRFIGGFLAGETFKPTMYNSTTYLELFK
jgi:hypothetical protein